MTTFLVSGLINLETTCAVDGWPVAYQPVRYAFGGVNATISGVGYNVATALHTLGSAVHLCALIGTDLAGDMARHCGGRRSLAAGISVAAHGFITAAQVRQAAGA